MKYRYKGVWKKISFSGSVAGFLKKIRINQELVVVTRNGKPVPENDSVSNADSVDVLHVVSGG